MNMWTILAIIAVFAVALVVAGIAMTGTVTADKQVSSGCGSCNGKCTAENNCGKQGCTAAETGTCNCGK